MPRKLSENAFPKIGEKAVAEISKVQRMLEHAAVQSAAGYLGERWWLVGQKEGCEPDILRLSADTREQLERKMARINIRPAEGVRFAVAHVRLYEVQPDELEIQDTVSVGSSVFGAMVRQVTA